MRLRIDGKAWNRGFEDGELGLPLCSCPYAMGTTESWSWSSGYIEGKAARHGHAASRPHVRPAKKCATAAEPCAVPLRSTAPGSAAEHRGQSGGKIARRSGVKVPRRLTRQEAAERLDIHEHTVARWAKHGIITSHAYNGHYCLYEIPDADLPQKHCSRWNRLADRALARVQNASSPKLSAEEERGAV